MPSAYCLSQTKVESSPCSSLKYCLVRLVRDASLAIVDERVARRIALQDILDLSCQTSAMQRDRHGHVVPAIPGVEQPVVVPLVLPGKEHHQPAPDVPLDQLKHPRHAREAEERTRSNHRRRLCARLRLVR